MDYVIIILPSTLHDVATEWECISFIPEQNITHSSLLINRMIRIWRVHLPTPER